jgi:hypothetical protein
LRFSLKDSCRGGDLTGVALGVFGGMEQQAQYG